MKKLFAIFGAALMLAAACTKEKELPFVVEDGKEVVKIIASVDQSRTTVDLDGNAAVYSWQTAEKISVIEEGVMFESFEYVLDDAATGTFIGQKALGNDLSYAVSPSAVAVTPLENSYVIGLPAVYNNYVPGTTNALMVGTPDSQEGDTYHFTFRHAAALIKFTYVNVPVGTSKFLFSTDKKINGDWNPADLADFVLETPEEGGKATSLRLAAPVAVPNLTMDFYVPVPVGEYHSFSVALLDENDNEIDGTVRSKDATTVLARGDVFVTPTITLPETSLAGSYIIVSKAATKGKWVAMQADIDANGRWAYSESEIAYDQPVNLFDSSIDFAQFSNINYRFNVESLEEGGYVLQNAKSGDYVQFIGSASNKGKEVAPEEKEAFDLFQINADGTWTIGSYYNDTDLYTLQYNVGNYFTFYKSNQAQIYLIPYVGAAMPVVLSGSCKNNVVTLTAIPDNAEIWYTVDGSEPDGTTPMTHYEEPFEITEDLILKAIAYAPDETYTDSDVFVLECTYVDPSTTAYYEKVTEAPVDWSGEYLLVCENQNLALSSISSTSTKYGIGAEVSISNEQILSDPTTNAYKVVIAGATDNGNGYTLMLSDIYLAWTSGNSLTTANSESDNSRWTISAGATSGNWIIANVAQSSREIWYNTGSPRFACYENKTESDKGYAPIQLYKLSDSRQKLPTPEGLEVDELEFTVSWNPVDGAASYNVVIGTLHDNTTETSYTPEGLEDGYYNVSVVAVSGDGQYADSDPATIENAKFGTPALPEPELSAGVCTGTSVQVTWTADERATYGYNATLYDASGSTPLADQFGLTNSVSFENLESGKEYKVGVYAEGVDGDLPYERSSEAFIIVSTTQGGAATIADMVAACPSDSYSLTGVTVVGVASTSNAFIGDGTGFALVYKSSHGLALGDIIDISGATQRYHGVAEFAQPAITKTSTAPAVEYGDPINPSADLMKAWTEGDFDITYISASGTQSGRKVKLPNGYELYLHKANTATDGKTVQLKGLVYGWSSDNNNFNFFFTSIEEDSSAPSLEVTPLSKTWAYDDTTPAEFTVTAANGTWDFDPKTLDYFTVNITDTGLSIAPKGENSTNADYSGTVTVTLTPSNGGDQLTKDIVLTQKFNSGSESVTLTGDDMAQMSNAGQGYGVEKSVTVDGYTWTTNGYQTSDLKKMIQLRVRTNKNGISYIKLPDFTDDIKTISMKVTGSGDTSYDGGSNPGTTLAFQAGTTTTETVIASGTATDKVLTIDLSDKSCRTGYIVSTDYAIRIWEVTVEF